MLRGLRARVPSHTTIAAYGALFIALGTGGAYAAGELIGSDDIARNAVLSKHIKRGNVKAPDIKTNAVRSPKVLDGSLLAQDFAAGQLPAPDTPLQVLDKVKQIDGAGSGLDSDALDGLGADAFAPAEAIHRIKPVGVDDPTIGGAPDGSIPLLTFPGGTVEATCIDQFVPGGGDEAFVTVHLGAGGTFTAFGTEGYTLPEKNSLRADGTTGEVVRVTHFNNVNHVQSATFVATTASGSMITGTFMAEVNDTVTGTDCTFSGAAISD